MKKIAIVFLLVLFVFPKISVAQDKPNESWAKFLLDTDIIPESSREKVNLDLKIALVFFSSGPAGMIIYLKPERIGFKPLPLSVIIKKLGPYLEEGKGEDDKHYSYKWGELVVETVKGSDEVITFGFAMALLQKLPKDANYFEEAKKCLSNAENK